MQLVEVRFQKGENKRFLGARTAAKKAGYPDVPTYLRATGQVDKWCEEIPPQEFALFRAAEKARAEAQAKAN